MLRFFDSSLQLLDGVSPVGEGRTPNYRYEYSRDDGACWRLNHMHFWAEDMSEISRGGLAAVTVSTVVADAVLGCLFPHGHSANPLLM